MKATLNNVRPRGWTQALAIAALALPLAGYSATVTQTVASANSGTAIDTPIWGDPAALASAGNDYVVGNLDDPNDSRLGTELTGRVRAYSTPYVFPGDSLFIPANAEFLIKSKNGTYEANFILDGGVIRSAEGGGAGNSTVMGTIHVASSGYVGSLETAGNIVTVAADVTGSSSAVLNVACGVYNGQRVEFTGDLSGFDGTFSMGGGSGAVVMDVFSSAVNASILTGVGAGTVAIGADVTFRSLDWIFVGETNSLAVGSYSSDELNDLFGTTQFTSVDTNLLLTVTAPNYPVYVPPVGIPAEIHQVTSNLGWNDLTSWSYNASMISTSDYFTVNLNQGVNTRLNLTVGATVRALNNAAPFQGQSLTVSDDTELLIKAEGGAAATCTNLVLAGGLIRYSPNGSPTATLNGGDITVTTNSYLGIVQTSISRLTVESNLKGGGDLNIRGGQAGNGTDLVVAFAGDLSTYTGDFILGEGTADITVDFDQDYDLPNLDILLNTADSNIVDRIQLDQTIKVKTFRLGGVSLPTGSAYTAAQLDSFFGVPDHFVDGGGTLEVYEDLDVPTVDPVITALSISGTDVTLSWTAEDVGTYSIERKTALTDFTWSTVISNLPAGDLTTNVTASGADQEFYQVTGE